jgi:O-antigen/teichoic acid export membrane protein
MLKAIKRLLEKTNNISRSSYIWNAAQAMILALQSPVVMAVATRTNGEAAAGIFSIALAEANLMYYLGQYGLRRYQSSDINQDFKFCEYHAMRIMSCTVMLAGCIGYGIYGLTQLGYSMNKFMIVIIICLIKVLQAYTDVMHGHLQQRGRLDVAGKCASTRYTIELLVYVIVLIVAHDLLLAVAICLFVSFIVFLLTSANVTRYYTDTMRPSISSEKLKLLLIEGFPLFMSLFLNMYISNAPKYAIDAFLNDEIQSIYNKIYMPTYVVQMATQFIFNPVLVVYAELWQSHTMDKFRRLVRMIRKMCLLVLGLAVLAVVLAATIAIPILSVIFGTDLSDYRLELVVIMLSGGMLAYSIYFSTLLAVIRTQRPLIYVYGFAAIAAKLICGVLVRNYSIMGAAIANFALMTFLAVSLCLVAVMALRRERSSLLEEKAGEGA